MPEEALMMFNLSWTKLTAVRVKGRHCISSACCTDGWANCLQIKGGPLLQKQLVHNATIASIVPRWQTFEASQFDLQVCLVYIAS